MKKIPALLVLICLIGGGVFLYLHPEHIPEFLRNRDEDPNVITLHGNVDIRRVNLGFRVSGRISEVFFEEGDVVSRGAKIATLDRVPYEDAVAVAESQMFQAQANYERLLAGSRPQEIEQARATLAEQTATRKFLEADYKRLRALVTDEAISQQEYETAQSRRDEAVARERRAKETLALLVEGPRKEDIAAGKAMFEEASANLKRTRTALNDTELFSPNDGVLLTRVEEPGAVVAAGQTVTTLSLNRMVWVYVFAPERQLGDLAPGMKAEIFTDTRPESPYIGHIGFISPEAEFTPKTVETMELRTTLVYRVRIIAESPDDGLRQGMPVTVRIRVAE